MARLYIKTPWSYETDSWVDVTSVEFNSKKIKIKRSTKIKFSTDNIYYNFSQEYPNVSNM